MTFILLLNVESDLFKSCFGRDEEWSCGFKSLDGKCPEGSLRDVLADPDLLCCVVQDTETHWDVLLDYYRNTRGAYIVYFGIYGVFDDPKTLSAAFGLEWTFSAYTKEDYVLTDVGRHYLGRDERFQNLRYTKSNLLKVPPEDRILSARKPKDIREYITDIVGYDLEGEPDNLEDTTDPDVKEEYKKARDGKFADYCRSMDDQAPLVLHRATSNGARIAYLGFVNGNGHIPELVRALLTGA